MSKKAISRKVLPAVPSFTAWQKAADALLTLETELARTKRSVVGPESPDPLALVTSVAKAKVTADGLFQIAFAEANHSAAKRQAHYASN
jgi:hypothetical protein